MAEGTWWVTRPTRDLRDLADSLEAFAKIARGRKWKGQRELHQRFEVENPAKTPNAGKYTGRGSGGRTWAAWLRMWGLWYNDNCVTITDAGMMILNPQSPEDVHKQIVHMIMTFQITSAYHKGLKRSRCDDFEIFPFRFMIKLMLDKRIEYLKIDEIMLFLLDVKTDNEYGGVVSKILDWRERSKNKVAHKKLREKLIKLHMEKHQKPRSDSPITPEKYSRSIRDIAQTLAINISYISELDYDSKSATVSIRKNNLKKVEALFNKYKDVKFSRLYKHSEAAFMRRFGIRYDRRKASRKDTAPMTKNRKAARRILAALEDMGKKGDRPKGLRLVEEIHRITNDQKEIIEKVLSENIHAQLETDDDDAELLSHYLECGNDGTMHEEFEILTRRIFGLLGHKTEKRNTKKKDEKSRIEIDGLILNNKINMSGLLECKAGKSYTLSNKDAALMRNDYIENFKTKSVEGTKYELDFFVYVVGSKFKGMNNLDGIIKKSGIRGSVIYPRELFTLYKLHKNGKMTGPQIWALFKLGRIIRESDML